MIIASVTRESHEANRNDAADTQVCAGSRESEEFQFREPTDDHNGRRR